MPEFAEPVPDQCLINTGYVREMVWIRADLRAAYMPEGYERGRIAPDDKGWKRSGNGAQSSRNQGRIRAGYMPCQIGDGKVQGKCRISVG